MHTTVGRIVLLVGFLLVPGALRAAQPVPSSPEFVVNVTNAATYYAYTKWPKVAPGANGEFVVVWEGYGYGYYGHFSYGIFGRRLANNGIPTGSVIEVSPAGSTFGNAELALDSDAAGNFVVAWNNPDWDIVTRRFTAAGTPRGPTFTVSAKSSDSYAPEPAVAVNDAGSFIVVWSDDPTYYEDNVYGHVFDATGASQGPVFQVNTYTTSVQYIPSAIADSSGNFVVSWKDYDRSSVIGRRVAPTGTPLAEDFPIDDTGLADIAYHFHPTALAPQPGGNFVAAWWEYDAVRGRRIGANDVAGPKFLVNQEDGPYGVDGYQAAASDPDGNFVVVWTQGAYYGWDIKGQHFLADGTPDGATFQVNERPTYVATPPGIPSLAADANGDFVVVWSNGNFNSYSEYGLRARKFAVCGNGRIGTGQTCDDGNAVSGDGCSATCDVETCFACSGEPSTCTALPGCGAVCSSAAEVDDKAILTINKIAAPAGDESITLRGKILNPGIPAGTYNPAVEGAEIAISGSSLIWARANPTPVPPGLVGTGCGITDGWKVRGRAPNFSYTYKNLTNALPPGCVPGSANGLKVMKFKDQIAKDGSFQFQLTVKNATLPPVPPAPVSATIVLGQSPGAAGQCARVRFTTSYFSKSTARFYPSLKLVYPPLPANPNFEFSATRARLRIGPQKTRIPIGQRPRPRALRVR